MRVLLLALLLAAAGYALCRDKVPTHEDLRAAALRLEFSRGVCSGGAIGPDTLISAKHCFADKLVSVDGQPVRIVESRMEGRDTAIVRVAGVTFKHWAKRGGIARQGEVLRFWGQPSGVPDVYREVIVSRAWTDGLILQGTICPGDSGSPLFGSDGRIVGIVSAVTGDRVCRFGLSL
jgi:hypothetical protein